MAETVQQKKPREETFVVMKECSTGKTDVMFEKGRCPEPHCGGFLIPADGCMYCPNCGWSACD